jgi:hypothetical protein
LGGDLARSATQADDSQAAPQFRRKGPLGRLSDEVADRLTQSHTVTPRMRFGHLDRIILQLDRRPWHSSIMSCRMMRLSKIVINCLQ